MNKTIVATPNYWRARTWGNELNTEFLHFGVMKPEGIHFSEPYKKADDTAPSATSSYTNDHIVQAFTSKNGISDEDFSAMCLEFLLDEEHSRHPEIILNDHGVSDELRHEHRNMRFSTQKNQVHDRPTYAHYPSCERRVFAAVQADPEIGRTLIAQKCLLEQQTAKRIIRNYGFENRSIRRNFAEHRDPEFARRKLSLRERKELREEKRLNPHITVAALSTKHLLAPVLVDGIVNGGRIQQKKAVALKLRSIHKKRAIVMEHFSEHSDTDVSIPNMTDSE